MIRTILLLLVVSWTGKLARVLSEIHVGTFCTKHEDCIRYCAYSKYGPEGTSCCFPEKIRISKTNWLPTGSNTCYCCPSQDNNQMQVVTTEEGKNILTTPKDLMKDRTEKEGLCLRYLNSNDVSSEFCQSGKCIQAMVIMKMAFEYPSACRSKKFPQEKQNKIL